MPRRAGDGTRLASFRNLTRTIGQTPIEGQTATTYVVFDNVARRARDGLVTPRETECRLRVIARQML